MNISSFIIKCFINDAIFQKQVEKKTKLINNGKCICESELHFPIFCRLFKIWSNYRFRGLKGQSPRIIVAFNHMWCCLDLNLGMHLELALNDPRSKCNDFSKGRPH